MEINDIFLKTLIDNKLIIKHDSILLGVSGGPDSICLLHLFHKLIKEYKLRLICAHFNHKLRESADEEENFVKYACFELGVRFISEKKDVKLFFKGDSLEQTARILRLDFFTKCARQFKLKKCALAHHKDDLVETMLMRMIRGTALKGLQGFISKSKFKGLTIIRPLIEIRKQEIIGWLDKEKITYCLDESNFEEFFFRNNVRLRLLPILLKFNPQIVDNLYNLSSALSLDYDFIHTFSYQQFQKLKRKEAKWWIKLDREALEKLHPAIVNAVLMIAIDELKGDTRRMENRHIQEIRELIFKRPQGSIVHLPFLLVKKEEKHLVIEVVHSGI